MTNGSSICVAGYNCSQPQQMSLSVNSRDVYNPPSALQYPEVEKESTVRPESPPSTSSSHSDCSMDLELELNLKTQEGSQSTNVSAHSLNVTHFTQDLLFEISYFLFDPLRNKIRAKNNVFPFYYLAVRKTRF